MMNRNPLPLWLVVSIFLAGATAVPLMCQLRSRPVVPPTVTDLRTLTEVAEVLSQAAPELRVVAMAINGSLESGMYLCRDSRLREQLRLLPRTGRAAGKWQGVVYCEREGGNISSIPESEIHLWGEYALHIEPFLFFGDPALLQRMDKIIRNHAKREER